MAASALAGVPLRLADDTEGAHPRDGYLARVGAEERLAELTAAVNEPGR